MFRYILAFVFLFGSIQVYSNTILLVESEITRNVPVESGLYISQSFDAAFNPARLGLNTKLYYRMLLYKNKVNTNSFLWKNTKIDLGVENIFNTSSDSVGVYINLTPFSFFTIKASGYFMGMFNALNFGYAGFTDIDFNSYSPDALFSLEKGSALGFTIRLNPIFHFKFQNIVILNSILLNYTAIGEMPYYFDYPKATLHAKNDIDLENDFYILSNIHPFYIGIYYGAFTVFSDDEFFHKIGIATAMSLNYLENSLLLDIGFTAGYNIGLPHYDQDVFVDINIKLDYKIPLGSDATDDESITDDKEITDSVILID